jgi:hypothetical protein
MTTHSKTYFVIVALTLSLLLHLFIAVPVLWDGELSWQAIAAALQEKIHQLLHPDAPDEVLARKKAKAVPRVTLKLGPDQNSATSRIPKIITIRLIQAQPQIAVVKPAPKAPPSAIQKSTKLTPYIADSKREQANSDLYDQLMNAPSAPPPAAPKDDSVNSSIQVALDPEDTTDHSFSLHNSLIDDSTTHIVASSDPVKVPKTKIPLATDEPPHFPVALQATYRTSAYGFGVNVMREWRMEGRRYNITDQFSAFGIHLMAISDGSLSEQGLQPDNFRIMFGNGIWRFAKFDRQSMMMTYGRPDKPKVTAFNSSIQDISSVGFQMALAYGDKAQDIQLTMGTGIYTLHLELTDEELLKLPVGNVRTIRIHGQSSGGNRNVSADVWLAPDYSNMPVKVRLMADGDKLEQSLSSLSIEGKVIFGKKHQAQPEAQTKPSNFAIPEQPAGTSPDASIPDALRNQPEF